MPVIDAETGEVRQAQLIVAVLGASNYTFAEATWTQSLPDWLGSHSRALTFFGGCPALIVPDNLRFQGDDVLLVGVEIGTHGVSIAPPANHWLPIQQDNPTGLTGLRVCPEPVTDGSPANGILVRVSWPRSRPTTACLFDGC